MPRLGPKAIMAAMGRVGRSADLEGVETLSPTESLAVAALWDRSATSAELAARMMVSSRTAERLLRALAHLGIARKPRRRWRIDQGQVRLCYYCGRPMAASPYNGRGQPMPYARAETLPGSYSRSRRRTHVCGGGPKLRKRKRLRPADSGGQPTGLRR